MQKLIHKIDELLCNRDRVIVAIDGCSGAGKTTLATQLSKQYDCNVIHMDDFFLRAEQRSRERLAMPGGNIDYKRFEEEVIKPLLAKKDFSFRPYDCSTGNQREPVYIKYKKLTIIEGTYSLHPRYRDAMDIKIFLNIDEATQKERIKKRNPDKYERFIREWIPMERQYFDAYIREVDFKLISKKEIYEY